MLVLSLVLSVTVVLVLIAWRLVDEEASLGVNAGASTFIADYIAERRRKLELLIVALVMYSFRFPSWRERALIVKLTGKII